MTSKPAYKLLRIDELLLPQHHYLVQEDVCLFLRDYLPGGGYQAGPTNDLILNLKKGPGVTGPAQYYRDRAIEQCAQELFQALSLRQAQTATFVPMPPSRCKSDPLYDDRLFRILAALGRLYDFELDVRELVVQPVSTRSSSRESGAGRLKPTEIASAYEINRALAQDLGKFLVVFDDVVTSGAHFQAMKSVLSGVKGEASICGLFIARTVH